MGGEQAGMREGSSQSLPKEKRASGVIPVTKGGKTLKNPVREQKAAWLEVTVMAKGHHHCQRSKPLPKVMAMVRGQESLALLLHSQWNP